MKRLPGDICRFACCILLSFMIFPGSALADSEPSDTELGDTQLADLVRIQQEYDEAQAILQRIGQELEQTQGLISSTENDLDEIAQAILKTQNDIEQTIKDLDTAQAALAAYLQITYKSGVLSFVDVLLASTDFNDFVTRTYYASAVQDSQVDAIEEIKQLKIQLEELEIVLSDEQLVETELLEELRTEEEALEVSKTEANTVVSGLSDEVKVLFDEQQAILSAAATARASASQAADEAEEAGAYNVGISQGSITQNAYACLGIPYVWAGDDESYGDYLGYDCSGFVQHCYALEGYTIGRTTWDQIAEVIENSDWKTSLDELEPGDLVFKSETHVGIYIGNGQMIDAPYPGMYIRIDTITEFIGGGSPI